MELILISSNKMKVILSEEEMRKYKLSGDGNTAIISGKRQFRSLLDEIKKKSGFDALCDSIYVELFESMRGGCEIFITKEQTSLPTPVNNAAPTERQRLESIITYKFYDASSLILASRRIQGHDKILSKLLADEEGHFYLSLTFFGTYRTDTPPLIFLDEYGERVHGTNTAIYLGEHGKRLIEDNAVERLSKL